ncbi:MAG: hypothetical protein E5X53_26020 [Mesorhizobium sp.]|uniref:hypothetical protein n=1 Tax=Mesorhizobium sp. TaxID=1871066 RepID=UPI0012098ED5|nr:hypothetical protein [Mesorhizobium sp.]TIR49093.1 MAG: hypothetical protein E5X53_26020 [Mesorhizobium sp.]
MEAEAIARLKGILTNTIENSSFVGSLQSLSAIAAARHALEAHCRGQLAEFRFWTDIFKQLQDRDPGPAPLLPIA